MQALPPMMAGSNVIRSNVIFPIIAYFGTPSSIASQQSFFFTPFSRVKRRQRVGETNDEAVEVHVIRYFWRLKAINQQPTQCQRAIAARTRNTHPTPPKNRLTIQNRGFFVSAEIAAIAIAIWNMVTPRANTSCL